MPTARHYLDHASTSPTRPEAVAAIASALARPGGDPGRLHAEGLGARVAVETAREQVAGLFGARPRSVIFTSGATESIATACWGAAERGAHQVLAAVEHSAVRKAAEACGEVTVVGVDRLGRVDPSELLATIRADTALVHLQWANHEVATVQAVAEVVTRCRERGVLVHIDAAQANGHIEIDFDALGADLVSVSAHKLGGPIGVGALLVRRGLRLRPLLLGGDQERARRAGLEPVALISGFGAAAEVLTRSLGREVATQRALTQRVLDAVPDLDGVRVFGDPNSRLPHLVCLGIDGVEPQAVLLGLDRAGIAAHSGSACASESLEPSPVLDAMGVDAHHSLRLSVGWSSTDADIDAALTALPGILSELRALSQPG
ncbi:MAG: cysteine desulfurase family protein [Acidimicrobiales bacterium]